MSARPLRQAPASRASDGGFTLIESLVAMVIFVVAMSVIAAAVEAMTTNMRQITGVSLATDHTRLAFQRLDKQVRYANAISTPGPGTDGTGWYVELRLNYEEGPGASNRNRNECRQWRLLDRQLQTRSWLVKRPDAPNESADPASAWRTVSTGVVNPVTEQPFSDVTSGLAGESLYRGLTVDLQTEHSARPKGRAQLKATFFARNASPSSSVAACTHYLRQG